MKTVYERALKDIIQKRETRQSGKFNGIPFPFPRWHDYITSIDKGMYLGYVGSTGSGKSRLVRDLLYKTYDFSKANNYPIKVLYFALEDGLLLTYKKMMTHYLFKRHNLLVPSALLDSKVTPLPEKYLTILREDREFYREFEESITIITGRNSPDEIYEVCSRAYQLYSDRHIIVIIDNYSNVTCDAQDKTEWDAVKRLSRNLIRLDLCQKKEMTVIAIMQTDVETDKNAFRGSTKEQISSLEPNLSSIGGNKVIRNDFYYLFALFDPWRYKIKTYPERDPDKSWNIEILRNRIRILLMLKNNEGEMAPALGLYFDGLKEIYSEMIPFTEQDKLKELYEQILKEARERKERKSKF